VALPWAIAAKVRSRPILVTLEWDDRRWAAGLDFADNVLAATANSLAGLTLLCHRAVLDAE